MARPKAKPAEDAPKKAPRKHALQIRITELDEARIAKLMACYGYKDMADAVRAALQVFAEATPPKLKLPNPKKSEPAP